MPFFASSHNEIYYRESGRGTAGLVLVHGWYQNGTQAWGALMPLLETNYRIFALDLPGHGLSVLSYPDKVHANDDLICDFISYVKKKYRLKRITVVGHSYGAFVVQQIIAKNAGIVDGAVALAAIDDYAPYVKRLKRVLRIPKFLTGTYYRLQGMSGAFPYGDRKLLYGKNLLIPPKLAYARLKNRTLSPRASHAYMKSFLSARVAWPKEKISTRLLLIYGESDLLTPKAWAQAILPRTSKGKMIAIADAGHNVQISGAAKVAEAIHTFVSQRR